MTQPRLCFVANAVFKGWFGVRAQVSFSLKFPQNVLFRSFKQSRREVESVFEVSDGQKVNKVRPLLLKEERRLIQALWLKPSVPQGSKGCVCGHV